MKLLDKTVRALLIYAVIVLFISVPVFYFIIEKLYFQDVDDALLLKKAELKVRTQRLRSNEDIQLWLKMDGDVSVKPSDIIQKDTIYPKLYLDTLDREIEPYRELKTSFAINGKNYLVTIRRSLVESEDLMVGIAEAQAVLLFLLFLGWIAINRSISKKIWKPFYEIIARLKKYEIDKFPNSELQHGGILEFDVLNKAVDDLIYKNHQTFINQKKFIENASHEMQTPVAILQSKLDLLLESERLTAEQARYLQSFYEAIERLTHLNKSLLVLSQIENQQFLDTSPVNLKTVIQKVIEHLEEAFAEKELQIEWDNVNDKFMQSNPILMEILISNLLINALHHTPADGKIYISLNEQTFTIENSGSPLPFEEEKLFTRFAKGKGTHYGVGLGLAIVKEICELHHFDIKYGYTQNHRFTISF